MSTVIVFGPTGSVASFVARTAQEHGAKVFLAMRDTQKIITGISLADERKGGFTRVQADLTNPDSVRAAVRASGAKRAFIYRAHTTDHMRSTLVALKLGGVDFVVFLSTYNIKGDPRDILPSEVIPYVHAQVEIAIDDVFGHNNSVALRPGGFATNLLRHKDEIKAGEVKLYAPDFNFDGIVPADIGSVGGTILVRGALNNQQKVYLYGPQVITQREGIQIILEVLGRDVQVTSIGAQEALDAYTRVGIPKTIAEYLVREFGATTGDVSERPNYKEGVDNVQLYTGKPATTLKEWVKANESLFSA